MKFVVALGAASVLILLSTTAAMLAPRDPQCLLVHERVGVGGAGVLEAQHVRHDLEMIERESVEFGRQVANRPLLSHSIDAVEGARTAPMRATAWCRATLIGDLAAMHRTTEAGLLAVAGTGAVQADADRASRALSTSPVVSRPSR